MLVYYTLLNKALYLFGRIRHSLSYLTRHENSLGTPDLAERNLCKRITIDILFLFYLMANDGRPESGMPSAGTSCDNMMAKL